MLRKVLLVTVGFVALFMNTVQVQAGDMRERYKNYEIPESAPPSSSDSPKKASNTETTSLVIPKTIIPLETQLSLEDIASKLLTIRNNPGTTISPVVLSTHVPSLHSLLERSADGLPEQDAFRFMHLLAEILQVQVMEQPLVQQDFISPLLSGLLGALITAALLIGIHKRRTRRNAAHKHTHPAEHVAQATAAAADATAAPAREGGTVSDLSLTTSPTARAAARPETQSNDGAVIERAADGSQAHPLTNVDNNSNTMALAPHTPRQRPRRPRHPNPEHEFARFWRYLLVTIGLVVLALITYGSIQFYRVDSIRAQEDVYLRAMSRPGFCDAAGHVRELGWEDYTAHPQWYVIRHCCCYLYLHRYHFELLIFMT